MGKHIGAYENYLAKLGGSLGTTVNHFNSAYRELKKVDKDVLRIAGESNGFEPTLVEKPVIDE